MKKEIPEDIKLLLKKVVDEIDLEDKAVRERQIRQWRKLKWFWAGFTRIYYSEVAHDWRNFDEQLNSGGYEDQAFYDKQINVFRAYLESIFAALSVTVPPITCFPDDADNPLDLETAKAGNKIAELIYRHNDMPLKWLNALFIFGTEGMVGCYNYSHESKEYGEYDEDVYEEKEEETYQCESCGQALEDDDFTTGTKECPTCGVPIEPTIEPVLTVNKILKETIKKPKSRQCLEMFGGLYLKVPNYARDQKACGYLRYSYETNYSNALERYPHLWEDRSKLSTGGSNADNQYEKWGRLSTQYGGDYPINNVTCSHYWIRPSYYNILQDKAEVDKLKKLYPDGVKATYINDLFCDAESEALDSHWTLTYNPLSDYIHFDPLGMLLVSIQEITNDLVSLTLQTIEHGIGQTFADPSVLNFDAYGQTESTPGSIFPVQAKTGRDLSESFFEINTATLSQEVGPFGDKIQSLGQFVSGAMPQIFGGVDPEASKTASGYAMQRAQSLQRLQNTWKVLQFWWKNIFTKAIPQYIEDVVEDEKFVKKDETGNFVNSWVRKSELQGRIGSVELEANENLPLTWDQQKDVIMQLMQAANPEIMMALIAPENLAQLSRSIGLNQFSLPGEQDRQNQYEIIRLLVNSQPLDEITPSVEIEPLLDDNKVCIDICKYWLKSTAGRQTKIDNKAGYMNVMLHLKQRMQWEAMQQQMMQPTEEETGKPENEGMASPAEKQGNNGQFGTKPGVVNS